MKKKLAILALYLAAGSYADAAETLPLHHLNMSKIVQLVSSARIAKEYFRQVHEQQGMWGEGTTRKLGDDDALCWKITTYNTSKLSITTEHGTKIQVNTLELNKIFDNKKLTGTTFSLKTETAVCVHDLYKNTYHWYPPRPGS